MVEELWEGQVLNHYGRQGEQIEILVLGRFAARCLRTREGTIPEVRVVELRVIKEEYYEKQVVMIEFTI